MQEASKELGRFQVALSQGDLAYVHPKVATDIFSSISYLDSLSARALARKSGAHEQTMCNYCNPNESITPNLNKAVHLLKRLGYDVYLKKIETD